MSFTIFCTCGCGEAVEASDAGFAATSVEVEACPTLRAAGVVSSTIRKSAAYAAAVPASAGWSHKDGLVTFG
jgi:hypothetical protein